MTYQKTKVHVTRIIDQQELLIDTLPVLQQRWIWDSVLADSLIF